MLLKQFYSLFVIASADAVSFPIFIGLALAPLFLGIIGANRVFKFVKGSSDRDTVLMLAATIWALACVYIVAILYKAEYNVYFFLVQTSRHML